MNIFHRVIGHALIFKSKVHGYQPKRCLHNLSLKDHLPIAATSYKPTDMKTIYSMGKGKYVHLDSYGETHENRLGNFFVFTFAIVISAITVGAALGIDITNINQTPNYEQLKR